MKIGAWKQRCSLVSSLAAVKHNILLLRHEAATALPVACPHMGQHGQFGQSQGRPQGVQWLLLPS